MTCRISRPDLGKRWASRLVATASAITEVTRARRLKRASAFRSSGEWRDDDYDVLADGVMVGRIVNKVGPTQVRATLQQGSKTRARS
jgi:hypothetical protein